MNIPGQKFFDDSKYHTVEEMKIINEVKEELNRLFPPEQERPLGFWHTIEAKKKELLKARGINNYLSAHERAKKEGVVMMID